MYTVLIVEDDPMVAMINEQFVSRHKDFKVIEKCADGESALQYLEKKQSRFSYNGCLYADYGWL